jgi:hypothetical protein
VEATRIAIHFKIISLEVIRNGVFSLEDRVFKEK